MMSEQLISGGYEKCGDDGGDRQMPGYDTVDWTVAERAERPDTHSMQWLEEELN